MAKEENQMRKKEVLGINKNQNRVSGTLLI
jgi:hypothetical protein